MKYDAIVVLGGGINYDGTLPEIPRYKVDLAVDLFRSNLADKIIMSTKWSGFLPKEPALTEAEAMKRYAISLGLPESNILKEEESMDTIGNALFVKQKYLVPNSWRKIIVITSDFHMPRTKYVFQKVIGSKYEMIFKESKSGLDKKDIAEREKVEKKFLLFVKLLLDNLQDGDDQSVKERIFLVHPFYSDRWKELIKLPDEELAKVMKVTVEVARKYKKFIRELKNIPPLYGFD